MMKELHVYINPVSTDTLIGHTVFYSRRADGPFYCWRYEAGLGQWLFSRVHLSHWTRRTLCVESWKAVPAALQARLGEHYLE